MFTYTDYENTYSDSDSDSYTSYSTDSSYTTDSSGSSNSSNFTITSDPSNYYRKDNLKQNYQKLMNQFNQPNQVLNTHCPSNYTSVSLRKKQTQNYLEMHRHKMSYIRDNGEENNSNINIINNNIGYNSGFNKDTPFINYLITKRINFCGNGDFFHIASFIPSTYSQPNCLIREWKGKDRYG